MRHPRSLTRRSETPIFIGSAEAERTSPAWNWAVPAPGSGWLTRSEAESYRRGDMREKRLRMMADWEAYCASPPAEKDNMVAMRA
jgi:hypothetical protein